jgi:peptidoglycan/LPS O-acetylase OafA/YrhL
VDTPKIDIAAAPAKVAAEGSAWRPDIDGLRALAVGGVLIFHAFPHALGGGYVGVDVFFVISGFLITQIVRGQTERGMAGRGGFSFAEFYERRIRRIFPALFVVAAATSLVALVILPPEDLKAYGRSLQPAMIFMANFHFWTRGSYFSPPQDVRPLLHLWSLGVEEQFYLFWPLLLVLARRWPAKALGPGVLLLVAASLIADEAVLRHDALAAFYSTPLRAWEPLLGALLATGWIPEIRRAWAREALSALGLAAIVGSMALLSEATPFPGLAAAPACLGAALLLHAGRSGRAGVVARLLSVRPAVWLGTASYSLYLWHWPILTFLRLGAPREPPPVVIALGLALSLMLSALTVRYVETPFRRPARRMPRRKLFALAAAGVAGLVLCGWGETADEGLRVRATGVPAQAMAAEKDLSPLWKACHAAKTPTPDACLFGQPRPGPPDVLLWGDSLAASWAPAVADWAAAHGLKGRLSTLGGCLPSLGVELHERDGTIRPCEVHNLALLDAVRAAPGLKTVVIAARWMMYDKGAGPVEGEWIYVSRPGGPRDPAAFHRIFAEGVERLIGALTRAGPQGLRIVLIGPSPEFPVNPDRCSERAGFVGRDPQPCLRVSLAEVAARQAGSARVLRAIARRHPNVTLAMPDPLFCDAAFCHAVMDGEIGFIDGDHLTNAAARRLGPALTKAWPVPAAR